MKEKKQKRVVLFLIVFITPFYAKGEAGTDKKFCTDSDGKQISHGTAFTPNYEEPCQRCICDNGYTTLCSTAACSPPPDCIDRKAIPRECCQFECGSNNSRPPSILHNTTLNDVATAEEDNITNLSLRLVASTVTSFLVLALLLFMVHRLRQRRLMMAMRRFEAQARQQRGDEDDGDHYIPAAFLHIECPPYEDPPPPYSPPKPPHILPADSPPPYEELENDMASDLDANANVSNNNNNNDQSCQQHGQMPRSPPGGDSQRLSSNQNANLQEAAEALNTSSEGSSLDSCSQGTSGGKSSSSSQGREEETEMKLISRRQSHPYDRNIIPSPQDYSLFSAAASRNVRNGASEQTGPKEPSNAELLADPTGRHRSNDGHVRGGGGRRGGGGVGRGARKTGRSCSFSLTRTADEDETMSGIALGPMSHSYHAATSATAATTIDSGVQTHGSYTASLLRHKGRGVGADRRRSGDDGDGERGGEQRMVTKPMVKCDAAVQHSHRLLQEELRRSLPRAANSVSDSCSPPSLLPSSFGAQPGHDLPTPPKSSIFSSLQASGHDQANSSMTGERGGERHKRTHSGEGKPRDRASLPSGSGGGDIRSESVLAGPLLVVQAGHKVALPRSQSVTSTFSVCSETGEVHVKKGSAPTDASVLQSDSQYPDQVLMSSSSPSHLSVDHPTSLPNYTFPSHASALPSSAASQCGGSLGMQQGSKSKTSTTPTSSSRRPVPSPPSQELRPAAVPSVHRSQSAKPKHKKIHLVPLEKSKTFKSKKEKKGSKKGGEADPSPRRHENRTNGCVPAQVGVNPAEQLAPPVRSHQPRLGVGDVMRARLQASAPSVKQYGFLDHGPVANIVPEAYIEGGRPLEGGKEWYGDSSDGVHPNPVPHHPLPHKSHTHGLTTPHHPAGHRGHVPHGDKPHPVTRPKSKSRPLSSGLVVEPGHDPSDTAVPHSSLARRRTKTLHLKKSRQSYPNPDGASGGERKALCVDLGFVEPTPESGRTVCSAVDMAPFPVPPKRRAVEKVSDKLPLGAEPCGVLEGRMSSYV